MKNRVCFWEINARDAKPLVEFYSKLFGWESSVEPANEFTRFRSGGGGAGGIPGGVFTGKGALPTHRCLSVEVEDAAATAAAAAALGSPTLQGPFDLEGVGRLAFFRDPEGHMLGLIEREREKG